MHSGSRSNQHGIALGEDYISQKACEALRVPAGRSPLLEVLEVKARSLSWVRWSAGCSKAKGKTRRQKFGYSVNLSVLTEMLDGWQRHGSGSEAAGVQETGAALD